jgi:hypothetical protein
MILRRESKTSLNFSRRITVGTTKARCEAVLKRDMGHSYWKMETNTKGSGFKIWNMVLAFLAFRMERFTPATFIRARRMDRVGGCFRTETATLGSGKTELAQGKVATTMQMDAGTKEKWWTAHPTASAN